MAFTLDKNLLSQLEAAWNGGDKPLDTLASLLERIGDGVRDPSLRDPLRQSGILDFVLKVLPTEELDLSIKRQCLRVLGNGCADCDENRAKLVESGQLRTVIGFLNDRSILPLLLPVLYNVIVDYEPAQLQVCEAGLSKALVALLQEGSIQPGGDHDQVLNLINNIFELLISQKPEPEVADPATPAVFLTLAGGSPSGLPSLELFNGFCTVALAYLTYESLQPAFLSSASNIQHLQQAFYNACFSYEDLPEPDLDDLDQLKTVSTTFVTLFADLSAHPSFAELYPLSTSPVSKKFQLWLSSDKFANQHLRTAACLCLGNLSRSDEASTALVSQPNEVHTHLAALLSQALNPDEKTVPATPQLLHAILSFAKNLAIPQANKAPLGEVFLPDLLAGAWVKTAVQPQVQFMAVSLARLLLVNSPGNVAKLCKPLRSDFKHTEKEEVRSYLQLLMTLGARSDLEPTKIETARAVMSVVRALQAPQSQEGQKVEVLDEKDWTREAFYEVHGPLIAKHLTHLLVQGKYPALRSEVLFVLALLARSTDGGASVVLRVLNEGTEAVKKLAVAVTGNEEAAAGLEGESGDSGRIEEVKDENEAKEAKEEKPTEVTSIMEGLNLNPQQAEPKPSPASTAKDRENGLVLVAEILRAHSNELKGPRKGVFEEILKKGTELLQNDRKGN
ncbi:armadillo-type protein [Sordaria brevicollis]|uniref:Armadillo-type protein n=1 Tax=Sordaria brevicollis TaxID=83679 RepID=A0AAE0PL27_SORBR|nr:armadillo-type protein [Sordaria brevicollis]